MDEGSQGEVNRICEQMVSLGLFSVGKVKGIRKGSSEAFPWRLRVTVVLFAL